jgi:predicted DNA-binding protein YlxM (UPF0122 family)
LIEVFVIKGIGFSRQMKKAEQIARLKEMRRLYEIEKINLREIAARFGVTWQAIHQKLTKAGVPLRQKSPVKRLLDRETLVQLYVEENLTIGETAKRLKAKCKKVSEELERHGIEKRSIGFFKRKQPELYQLKVGEKAVIQRPSVSLSFIIRHI